MNTKYLKSLIAGGVACGLCVFAVRPVFSAQISDSDLWQWTNIQSTSTSGLHAVSTESNLFDGVVVQLTPPVITPLIFQDAQPEGYVHWIEWTLVQPTTINAFNIYLAHDALMTARGASRFVLEAYVNTQWESVYDYTITPVDSGGNYPSYGGGEYYTAYNHLDLYRDVTEVTAQTWKLSVTQFGNHGSRVYEIDGLFNAPAVPEPASMSLLLLGIIGLIKRFLRK